MSLNESIVEDAALEWFLLRQGFGGQVGEQTRFARTLTPALSQGERESDGEVVQFRCAQPLTRPLPRGEAMREAIRRLNPAIPEEARATGKRYLQVRLERTQNP
jgi:hypothetical protein